MMFVACRPFPVPLYLSANPTYSPADAYRMPPLRERFATKRFSNVTACNPRIGHPRSDMEPYPHFARIHTIWLQTSLVAKVGWWRRIVSVWRYRNARTVDRMLDYRPLRHTGAGGVGLIKTISVACLQCNNVLSVWEAWNGLPYLLISNFLYTDVCVSLCIIVIRTVGEPSAVMVRLFDGLLC